MRAKVPFPPSKILDFWLRISKPLEVLSLVLRMAQGLAASALSIQASEENTGSLFPQQKRPEAIMIFNIL